MYNSKYYTCEQIDQRLLEGYYDDAVAAGYTGSKAQYLAGLLKAINYSANPTITADKVVYNPAISGLTHKNIQDAIDELANKKANSEDVDSKIQTEQERVNAELDKKFDKENIAQEFGDSDDKVVSQFALPFREIESPEFIKSIVDAEDHFLFGIQLDGSIEWGKGIPAPIRSKLQEIINQCQNDKTDILEAINAAKEELSASITSLQEGKVDKEEGKSLIEDEVKECFRIIENEEFLKAIVDSDDKVLFGFYRATGEPYYPMNDMYHVIHNEEYFAAWVTTDDKVVLGIRRDGQIIGEIHAVNSLKQVISQLQLDVATLQEKVGTIDTNLKELLDVFSLDENPEYMAVEKDADGKVLFATNADGSHYIHNAKSETIPTEFSHIEDPDGRLEIVTDADDKVVSYRDKHGTKYEKKLCMSNLILKDNSVNDIKEALLKNGFNANNPLDWSDHSFIQISEPQFALINITNIDAMPETKTQNEKAFFEFWDMHGNYFKKHAILNAQGNSSLMFDKKNIAVDLCDDEWIGDKTPKIRIGSWVSQDSFHLKAYYTDFFRGVGAVAYKLYDQITRTRGNLYDSPWKKALIDSNKLNPTSKSFSIGKVGQYDILTDTGARCFPDGFPCAVYLNGDFYGIFSFQLKKHRDVYHLDKSKPENIHLDGTLNANTIFCGKNNIRWGEFEIRNPKNLYSDNGGEYTEGSSLATPEKVNQWIVAGKLPTGVVITDKIKKNLNLTIKVRDYIEKIADILPAIKELNDVYDSSKLETDRQAVKNLFEKYFDVDNLIDFIITIDITQNGDATSKNWQWFTYNGEKLFVGLYDCDCSFGAGFTGEGLFPPDAKHKGNYIGVPSGYIIKYYEAELQSRYKELADKGIISFDNIFHIIKDWTMRIGTDNFKKEFKKWKDSPCANDSIVREDYWELMLGEDGEPITESVESFNATIAYNVGDTASFGYSESMGIYKFKCVKATVPQIENHPHKISDYSPIKEFRHCDSLYRIEKWIEVKIKLLDSLYNYNRN